MVTGNCLVNFKNISNLGAILSFTMQAQICSAPIFLTSLRASWLCLIAQNRVFCMAIQRECEIFIVLNLFYLENKLYSAFTDRRCRVVVDLTVLNP